MNLATAEEYLQLEEEYSEGNLSLYELEEKIFSLGQNAQKAMMASIVNKGHKKNLS